MLAPLALDDVGRLIADALHTASRSARGRWRELVLEKTAGNPFFAIQFLMALAEEGLLAFDPDASAWRGTCRDPRQGLHRQRRGSHGREAEPAAATTQEALGQLACLGNVAEIATLALVHGGIRGGDPRGTLGSRPRRPRPPLRTDAYTFLHDRVQEAAYALIPEGERAMAHLRIGRLLAAQTTAEELEESIFDIVNQFDRGAALITTPEEREQVAELNLMAGKRAKAATAYAVGPAVFYRRPRPAAGESMGAVLPLTFDLELNWAECEYLTGELASAEERLSVLSTPRTDHRRLLPPSPACASISTRTLDQSDSAVEVGLDYLRRVDGQWSPHRDGGGRPPRI